MKTIENQFKELIEAIDQRLLDGDFVFMDSNEHTATIRIDGINVEYWIANKIEHWFKIHSICGGYLPDNLVGLFSTQSKKREGYNALKPYINKHQ